MFFIHSKKLIIFHFVSSLGTVYKNTMESRYAHKFPAIVTLSFSWMPWCAKSCHSCPTLCNPMHYSVPGSSVHGILQERLLKWVAMLLSRDLPNPGIEPESLYVSYIAGIFFTIWATREAPHSIMVLEISQAEKDKHCMVSLTCGI